MTRIRLTAHWIVSDCDLEKVSVCTPSRDCAGLHMHVDAYVRGISGRNSFKGGECETPRKSNFSEKWQNGNFDQNPEFF